MTDINEIEKYVISHLDDAIANKWIEVYYQPVVRTITGKICGCEALARWHDPHYGLLSPIHFVPALETSGDIYKLDLTIIEKVCQDLHFALSTHKSVIPLSINLSRHDFSHENLIDDINSLTQHYEIPHRLLNIEITESLFVEDLGMIKKFINAFHQEGYQVWMDDFGSGYSSLGVLKDFDFDEIKIDMSFLTNFNDKSKEIIKFVVRMAKLIGIQTLAEGVETKEQYEFLKDIGCEKIQGYYFGRPMPQALLREHFRKKGIARENLAYQHFYDAIAQIDYQTYAPLLVCTLKNKQFHFLHVNEAYKQILKRDDIKSVSQWEQILNDQTNPMHRLHLEVARKTYRRQAPTIITYPRGDHYMELTVEYIAQQNNVTAFKAELHYIDIKHPDREDIKIEDEYVRDIYYACHDIAVMDLKNDTIREIKSGNSDQPIAHHPISHDIRNIFDRYQNGFIHKADQEAFRRFYDFDSLQNRLKKAPNGLISEYFRSKNDDDDYMWVHHMYIAIPKTHYQKILIFAISADVDHDKLMKILERDRYVLKDRMEIS